MNDISWVFLHGSFILLEAHSNPTWKSYFSIQSYEPDCTFTLTCHETKTKCEVGQHYRVLLASAFNNEYISRFFWIRIEKIHVAIFGGWDPLRSHMEIVVWCHVPKNIFRCGKQLQSLWVMQQSTHTDKEIRNSLQFNSLGGVLWGGVNECSNHGN